MFPSGFRIRVIAMALLLNFVLLNHWSNVAYGQHDINLVLIHRVTGGQNLYSIADKYGVRVKDIVAWNNIADPDKLFIGQKLTMRLSDSIVERSRLSNNEKELLARIIYAEARGEDFEGQVAVGAVVLNRLRDPQFPKTLKDVVYQPGAFTAISDRQINLKPDKTAWKAAEAAISGEDPTGGALFYYNSSLAMDKWIKTRPVLKVIGNHTFSI